VLKISPKVALQARHQMQTRRPKLQYLSINSITCADYSLEELIKSCLIAEIQWVSPWQELIKQTGPRKAAKMLKDAGIRVPSLCRGGFFTSSNKSERERAIFLNIEAIDVAVEIGAQSLVIVAGPIVNKDLNSSQQMVEEGLSRITAYAKSAGITLALEPLHPMLAATRSCVTSIRQALEIASKFDSNQVKIIVDAYHVWSDPYLLESTDQLVGNIGGFHISDWVTPIQNELESRGMPGEGCINLNRLYDWVSRCGWDGPIEVEVISAKWRGLGPDICFSEAITSYMSLNFIKD